MNYVRWFISSLIVTPLEDGGIRRSPSMCERIECVQWSCVYFGDKTLIRVEGLMGNGLLECEELVEQEQWASFYQAHPDMKHRWSDQPNG